MSASGPPTRVLVLDQSIKVLYQSILVLALYFEFAGHNLPGGGFVGGLMAGAAVSLRYVSGGAQAVRSTFRAPSHVILGVGLVLSTVTAFVPVLLGGSILEHGEIEGELPIFGKVKVVSALPFDAGVFLVVVGLVLMAFAAFGDDAPPIARLVGARDDEVDDVEHPVDAGTGLDVDLQQREEPTPGLEDAP